MSSSYLVGSCVQTFSFLFLIIMFERLACNVRSVLIETFHRVVTFLPSIIHSRWYSYQFAVIFIPYWQQINQYHDGFSTHCVWIFWASCDKVINSFNIFWFCTIMQDISLVAACKQVLFFVVFLFVGEVAARINSSVSPLSCALLNLSFKFS